MNRRGFLTSFGKKLAKEKNIFSHIFLPYINNISLVEKICTNCEKPCVDICESSIIVIKDNLPILDMSKNGCTFCKKCAIACSDKGVLNSNLESKIDAIVNIKTVNCLSWNNTMCFTCKDGCDFNAIKFFGAFRPTIDVQTCTSCGMCINLCPTNAIEIKEVFPIKDKR